MAKSVSENIAMWIQAVGAILAVLTAGFAFWFNVMPWCDMANVEVMKLDGGVKLKSRVRNAGRGQAFQVRIWLLEYGGITDLKDSRGYIGALSPDTELVPPYESAELSLGGKVPINPGYVLYHDNEKIVIRNYEGKIFEYPETGNENVQFAPQREYHDEYLYS